MGDVSEFKVGNVVRYVGRERRDELGGGKMWRVAIVAKTGRVRLSAMSGAKGQAAPVWVSADEIEYVGASSSLGAGPRLPEPKREEVMIPAPVVPVKHYSPSAEVEDEPKAEAPKTEPFTTGEIEPVKKTETELSDEDKAKLDQLLADGFGEPSEVIGETCELDGVGCVLIESRQRRDGTRKVRVTVSEDAEVSGGVRALIMEVLGVGRWTA